MTRTNIKLDKNHLLAFLVRTSGLTDHYVSSQPLNLFIPYSEYSELIKELASLNLDILNTPISVYKKSLSEGEYSKKMIKLFHLDVALSSLSEVSKSYSNRVQCTRIFGNIDFEHNQKVFLLDPKNAADFVVSNFSQSEQQELILKVLSLQGIPSEILKPSAGGNSWNTFMFYYAMANYGVYLFNKDFIISIKEDSYCDQ